MTSKTIFGFPVAELEPITVYVVMYALDYETKDVQAVFSSEELARAYVGTDKDLYYAGAFAVDVPEVRK